MKFAELQQEYINGRRDFSWIKMPATYFGGTQFPEIIMTRSSLAQSNFEAANFNYASFRKADLSKTSWHKTQAEAAIFVKANLPESNFTQANLAYADFTNANLVYANFSNANLEGANFSQTYLRGAIFFNANLQQAKFYDADTTDVLFDGSDFTETKFPERSNLLDSHNEDLLDPYVLYFQNKPFVKTFPFGELHNTAPKKYSFFTEREEVSRTSFWLSLPRYFLLAWGLGYFLLAQKMIFNQVPWGCWFLAILSSWIWYLDEELIWFVPFLALLASVSLQTIILGSFVSFFTFNFIDRVFSWFKRGVACLQVVQGICFYK